jgi:hypothetical protein
LTGSQSENPYDISSLDIEEIKMKQHQDLRKINSQDANDDDFEDELLVEAAE